MSNLIRTAAAQVIKDLNLSPTDDPYPGIVELAKRAQISHDNARGYIHRALRDIAEGRDPVKSTRGGKRRGAGWKRGVPRKPKEKAPD